MTIMLLCRHSLHSLHALLLHRPSDSAAPAPIPYPVALEASLQEAAVLLSRCKMLTPLLLLICREQSRLGRGDPSLSGRIGHLGRSARRQILRLLCREAFIEPFQPYPSAARQSARRRSPTSTLRPALCMSPMHVLMGHQTSNQVPFTLAV